jgi:hypothetical protein
LLAGLVAAVAAACSSSDSGDDSGDDAGAGMSASGKNTSSGGRAGSSGSTSKGGKAGSTSRAGSAGTGGTPAATAGAAGEAGAAAACPGCDSGFCLDDGTCVDCLPKNDHCPQGEYCTDANSCVSGCKTDGSSCASGVCNDDHNCQSCINDDECSGDDLCGNGQCAAACTANHEGENTGCGAGLTCCSLHCTDIGTDEMHCGACGTACGDAQFCGLTACAGGEGGAGGAGSAPCVACHDTTVANVCSIGKIIVILDTTKNPSDGNRVPGRTIGKALEAQCLPKPVLIEAEQDSVEALNLTTGRPVSGGGELLVVAGGPFFQNLEGYLETQHVAPLYLNQVGDTATEFRKTLNDDVVLTLPIAGDHESHDFFIIQFMRDPESGSLVLNAQGFWLSGTVAAAYQVQAGLLPQLATQDKGWYAYEWTDMNADKKPDANEIVLKASGN